ncbi:SRPBCC domain-containing protein [Chryseobacterium camelliae]|uniref:SRPBCC domain-containing protein n=1 Tax=Chryseobacterium camelliae TaxID=1265445 RepID=A0ABY7QN70_9FLAO|nr:SRPBCC domain-containing protein [Chryseobacterium camelliae]WBV60614.1 SRPBCC domain-containing protein [Chryseobacterium camelliae]
MPTQNFSYTFTTSKPRDEVFNLLINPKQWWMGLHDEIITGKSEQPNDVFIFDAGNGVHHTEQKMIEAIPDQKITWEVTDSNLTFADKSDEWTGTRIGFDISKEDHNTKVVFTHDGLTPEFECYDGCSSAWTQYLEKLEKELN